jgi:hypothetical protein
VVSVSVGLFGLSRGAGQLIEAAHKGLGLALESLSWMKTRALGLWSEPLEGDAMLFDLAISTTAASGTLLKSQQSEVHTADRLMMLFRGGGVLGWWWWVVLEKSSLGCGKLSVI